MKKFRLFFVIICLLLVLANLSVFSYSISLSDRIATTEEDIKKLTLSNSFFKKKFYSENSFEMLYVKAKILGFDKKATTFYFPQTKFAYSQNNIHE